MSSETAVDQAGQQVERDGQRPERGPPAAQGMLGQATATLGSGLIQRKLAQRRAQRELSGASAQKTAPSVIQRKEATAAAEPDYAAEYASLTFQQAIEGGLAGYKGIREALLGEFGTLEAANKYYKKVDGSPFLGHDPIVHKATLGTRLARAESLLKTKGWLDAVLAGNPQPGGFNVRQNRNSPGQLSDHSFGWAVDIDADLNPNIKEFPAAAVKGLSGEGMFTGTANAQMLQGGTAAELLPWAQQMQAASDKFEAAFTDEAALKKAMVAGSHAPARRPATGSAARAPHGRAAQDRLARAPRSTAAAAPPRSRRTAK